MPLRLESDIKQRLTETVPGLLGVWGLPAAAAEQLRPTPCAYVLFTGLVTQETRTNNLQARVSITWRVVVSVRDVTEIRDGSAARSGAQDIAEDVCSALMGWTPDASKYTPLRLEGAPAPLFESGSILLGLDFSSTYVIGA